MGRYYPRGKTQYHALPAVADPDAGPTRPELDAGTRLTDIASVSGFTLNNSPAPTPDLDSKFTSSVPGEDTAETPSFTFWDDDDDTTIRDVLAKDTSLFIVRMPYGDVPGKRCEVWDVTSTGVNDGTDMGTPGQFMVGFSVNETPVQDAVIPAA